MANASETAPVLDGQETAAGADELKLLAEAVRALPVHAVKDMIGLGVCVRCIFRLFNVHEGIYFHALVSPTTLYSIMGKVKEAEGVETHSSGESENVNDLHSSEEIEVKSTICTVCLGVLQFTYRNEQDILMEKKYAKEFAIMVAENVKQTYHEIVGFSLEVSLPGRITENDQMVVSYLKRKYASELWFREMFTSEPVSVKDALKLSITHPLQTILGVKSSVSDFHVRLTYEHLDATHNAENTTGKDPCNKRIKTVPDVSHSKSSERNGLAKCSNGTMQDNSDFKCQLEKVGQPCKMTLLCTRGPIFFGGRYLKLSRNVSQTRWIIDDERKGEASVEEIIGSNILPACNGDGYKFHAAGREDIDVRMLGSGRPFLVEIQNARHFPSDMSIKEIERKINSLENNLVKVKHLKILGSQGWTLMREGEAEKQKQYAALVWISRPIKDDDLLAVSSLKDLQVLQRTPIRVLHRRSPLEREKIIHWMRIEKIAGSSQYFLLHLCSQAGTYIKEFVHGDLGRTHPSIGSILGCRAEILQLDVTNVIMDGFLDE